MNLARAGVWITAMAIVLAIPLTILGNVLTPRVVEWYAKTTQGRLRKRIAKLEARLHASEAEWTFTKLEWEMYRTNNWLTRGTMGGFICLFATLAIFTLFSYRQLAQILGSSHARLFAVMVAFSYFLSYLIPWRMTRDRRSMRELHTDEGRQSLRKDIEGLRALLK
jgi:hypothetical protein